MIKAIIFDFDGVIAESIQVKTDAFSELYSPYGNDVVEKVVSYHLANGGVSRYEKIKYFHESFLKRLITKVEIRELANQFSELVIDKVISAPSLPGVIDYIHTCHEKYTMFISTGTPTDEINQILKSRGISNYFTDIFGSPQKKGDHIKKIISKFKIRPDELLFYGDSDTDHDAAEDANINFVLIKNRFNEKLRKNYKGKIINNFLEIV